MSFLHRDTMDLGKIKTPKLILHQGKDIFAAFDMEVISPLTIFNLVLFFDRECEFAFRVDPTRFSL